MKPQKPKSKLRVWLVPMLFLALVCITGAELLVCHFADPALFDRITAPVINAVSHTSSAVAKGVSSTASSLSQWWEDLTTVPESDSDEGNGESSQTEFTAAGGDSALLSWGGSALLPGGTVDIVYYNQSQSPWAEASYGTDTIDKYGCGPTVMAILISSLTDRTVTPAEMAEWAAEHGYWVKQSGSRPSLIPDACAAFGLTAEGFTEFTPDSLRRELSNGKIFVALMAQGHFTQYGHFIILRGVTADGDILVADPNSTDRSLMAWNPQLILDELSVSKGSGSPLWVISCPS